MVVHFSDDQSQYNMEWCFGKILIPLILIDKRGKEGRPMKKDEKGLENNGIEYRE